MPKRNKVIVFSLFLFSLMTVVPGFYFREHYFITMLPVIGLFVALFFEYLNEWFTDKFKSPKISSIVFFIFFITAGSGVYANRNYLFFQDTAISCKQEHGSNPFVESIEIAAFIKTHTTSDDKIAILGSEPQICFYSSRHSATGYIYVYDLVEIHAYALAMQKEMAKEIEINQPKYVVYVNVYVSWLPRPNSDNYILRWASEYLDKKYRLIGLEEILPDTCSVLKIGEEAKNYVPQSKDMIYIFEKIHE